MKIEQRSWTASSGWTCTAGDTLGGNAQLVFVFGSIALLRDPEHYADIRRTYPHAHIVGCSTAGEICGTRVIDDSIVTTAVHFEATRVQAAKISLGEARGGFQVGEQLAAMLDHAQLTHVLLISDGTKVDGSGLVKGLASGLPAGVALTGGLAGAVPHFGDTLVCLDGPPETGIIAVVGLYGDRLRIGYGSVGGWDAFGPERRITRSVDNVVYELDGQSALALYKRYLGEHATGLPSSGLLFPLLLRKNSDDPGLIRTIMGVDEEQQSISFAGDVPEGMYVRLMKANFDRLVDGAGQAAQASYTIAGATSPDLALLISCFGRRLVLRQRVDEELESVREILGP
jgi:hypothetical protein